MREKQYWMITIQNDRTGAVSTWSIDKHPADWLAEFGHHHGVQDELLFAMPITKEQHDALEEAGYQ